MEAARQAGSAPEAVGGIDLGGTKIEAIVTDTSYRVLGNARHPTPTTGGPADVANAMAAAVTEAAKAAGLEPAQLLGVGVGSPGSVDSQAGTVARAENLPGWYASFPLAAALASALGTKVNIPTLEGDRQIEIPAGAQFGTRITVPGAGVPHLKGIGRGDLHVQLEIAVPKKLSKEQRELLERFAAISGEETAPGGGFFQKIFRD